MIVKPAMAYLDVIRMARDSFDAPIVAYNVSGEYAMIKAAAQLGWIDERRVAMETLTSIKRAGAGRIITYHAKEAAAWLREGDHSVRRAGRYGLGVRRLRGTLREGARQPLREEQRCTS